MLRLLVAGASNKEIARELDLNVNTVKSHVRNVYTKLGVRSPHHCHDHPHLGTIAV